MLWINFYWFRNSIYKYIMPLLVNKSNVKLLKIKKPQFKIFTIKLHLQESEKFSFLKISIEYNVRYWRNYEEDF